MRGPRIKREQQTLQAMVRLYCGRVHRPEAGALCADCQALLDYGLARLERCKFQEEKPVCNECPVHCYRPNERQRVKQVMRFAGPRMLLHHPIMSVYHWFDSLFLKRKRQKR